MTGFFDNYEYFMAIAEEKNITRASEKLYVSQPSLTKYLKRLECNLGADLFDHRRKPLVLTEAGKIYYNYLKEFQKLNISLRKDFEALKQHQEDEITIAMGSYFSAIMLPSIMPILYREHPNIKIHVIVGDDAACYRALCTGHALLSIHFMPQNYSNVAYETIVDEPMYLFCKADYVSLRKHGIIATEPGVQSVPLNLKLLENEPFFIPPKGLTMNKMSYKAFKLAGIKPKKIIRVPDVQSAVNMASVGQGFCLVPGALLKSQFHSKEVVLFPFSDPPLTCPLGVIYRPGTTLTEGMHSVIDALRLFYH